MTCGPMEIGNMEPIMGYIGCKDKFVNKKKEKRICGFGEASIHITASIYI